MRLAFVVTTSLAVGACQPKGDSIQTENPPPPKSKASMSASAPDSATVVETTQNPPPPKVTRKRKHTSDAGVVWKTPKKPVDWAKLKTLNPTDPTGHQLYVGSDDRCFYEVTPKGPVPPMPTGARWVEPVFVDCPVELDDPAWDHCTYSTLHSVAGESYCLCSSLGGNPPPPPNEVACPKK
ncbi:MAG: hypothetical protein JNL79_20910 [Myxococcales bacterium]|nr:hypothetical protein [Myxococcales bacterium]